MPRVHSKSVAAKDQKKKTRSKNEVEVEVVVEVVSATESEETESGQSSDVSSEESPPRPRRTRNIKESAERKSRSRSKSRTVGFESLEESPVKSAPRHVAVRREVGALHSNGPARSRSVDKSCSILLQIHRIDGLDSVRYRRPCLTATAVFKGEEIKSLQVPSEKTNLTKDFSFQWTISKNMANDFLEDPRLLCRRFKVTIKVENDELEALVPWTHIVGSVELPGDKDKEDKRGFKLIKLEGTHLEPGAQLMAYSLEIVVGSRKYAM